MYSLAPEYLKLLNWLMVILTWQSSVFAWSNNRIIVGLCRLLFFRKALRCANLAGVGRFQRINRHLNRAFRGQQMQWLAVRQSTLLVGWVLIYTVRLSAEVLFCAKILAAEVVNHIFLRVLWDCLRLICCTAHCFEQFAESFFAEV